MRFRIVTVCLALAAASCAGAPKEDSAVGDYLYGRLAARTKEVGAAADAFARAQADAPGSPELLRDAFFFQLASGDIDQAAPYAEKLVARDNTGDDGLALVTLSARALREGRYGEARRLADDERISDYLKATANILRAWAVDATDGPEAALEAMRAHAGKEYKGFYPLHQGFLAEAGGDSEEARQAFQLAVMSFGGSVEVTAYGAFLERSGAADEARQFYDLVAGRPGLGQIPAERGLDRLDAGKAADDYKNVTPAQGAAIAFYNIANAILQQTATQRQAAEKAGFHAPAANYNMPLAFIRLALYLDPSLDDARRLAGSILNEYGDSRKAMEVLSLIPPHSAYYEQSQIDIARALNAQGRGDDAVKTLRRATRAVPHADDAALALAGLYAAQHRDADAVKTLDGLIARHPDDAEDGAWRYYLSRGAALLEMGDWPKAEADLKHAYKLAPEQPSVLNYLGYSWAERGDNLDEAFELIEKAVSLEPNSGAIIDSLGWANYQLGRYDEAVGHLEQAASLEPGDPTITDHLGDVYWRLGRRLEARYQWLRVLELEPDAAMGDEVRAKLKRGLAEKSE